VFWLAAILLGITYAGMPLVTLVRARVARREHAGADIEPLVSLVIAAHNEAGVIRARLENLVQLDYPRDRLEIIIVSDGSTDGTDDIVAEYADRGIRLLAPGRVGKGAALEAGVAASTGGILVFSDANSQYAPDAVRALVRPFADPEVGGVAGNQVYLREGESDGTAVGERGYWDFDRLLKRSQSVAGSVTSGTGAIYAIRREHFGPIPEGVTDDMLNTIRVVDAGQRLVFAEDAVAFEPVAPSGQLEFRRKVRIMTRSFRALVLMRRLFDPRRTGWYAAQLLWHKVLLRTAAVPLLALAVVSPLLWRHGPIYRLATVGQAVCYGLAAAGIALARHPIGRAAPLAVPAYFTLVNVASLRALWNLVRGDRIDRWVPTRTNDPARSVVRLLPGSDADSTREPSATSAAPASSSEPAHDARDDHQSEAIA
jgi:cellulose synthase/poly-beta-1,6-N-acetylglucosamine synthase-like glycosyltransferase